MAQAAPDFNLAFYLDSSPNTSSAKLVHNELIDDLRHFFVKLSVPVYLVGGSVRDILMGRKLHDLDVAVKGDAAELGSKLRRRLGATLVPLGHTRQLVRLVLPTQHFTIDISPFEGEIEEDLARRDYTIDAMAIPLWTKDGDASSVIDPLNGAKDIKRKLLRTVSPEALRSDPARLIRGPRLASQLGFAIEKRTSKLIKENANLISGVAAERVRDELMKLLAAPNTSPNLRLLDDLGLLRLVIPELEAAVGVVQPKEHHWDVFYHCIEAAGAVERVLGDYEGKPSDDVLRYIPWYPWLADHFNAEASDGYSRSVLLKLTALLHDIAKPQTKTIEDSGRTRFFGHSEMGAEMAQEILERLRFSRHGVSMVCKMIEHHLRPSQISQRGEFPTRRALFKYFRDMGEVAIDTLYLNLADYLAARGPNVDLEDWKSHCSLIDSVLAYKVSSVQVQTGYKLVNGHDIMQAFGLNSGKMVGELLKLVQEAQGAGEISTKEQALDLLRAKLPLKEGDA